ncbi:MAG: hypothetical protein AAGC84_04055 [Pseudomonas sp.]
MRFRPFLALLAALVFPHSALAAWFGKDSPPLAVERKVSQNRDWNTGMLRDEVSFTLRMHGSALSDKQLGKALGAPADEAHLTTLFDAVSSGPDAALVVYRTSGNYRLARLQVQGKQLSGQALVDDLAQNWFTDARMPGWVSVQQDNHLHLVQLNPLRVVDVGAGVLLDVRGDLALLAQQGYNEPDSTIRAVSISTGRQVATLLLPQRCFALPQFEFTHPLVYARIDQSTLETLRFQDGPAWFDTHFTVTDGPTPRLQLKAEQRLPRPALQRWYVGLREPDLGRQPRTPEAIGYAASPTFDDTQDTIDPEPTACTGINANPRLGDGKAPYPTQTVMAEDLCLGVDLPGITPAMRQQRCVLPASTQVVARGAQWQLEELRFSYRPQQGGAPIEQQVYQLREGDQLHRAIAGDSGEDLRLREVLAIGDDEALIKARGEGAYELFRLYSDKAGKRRLEYLDTVAYPASPFDTSKPGWVYLRSAGLLIREKPFGFEQVGKGLLDIRGNELLFQYQHDGNQNLVLISLPFVPAPQARDAGDDAARYQLRADCRLDDDPYWEFAVPPVNATLAQSAAWFSRNFNYTNGRPQSIVLRKDHQLRVKTGCSAYSK